MFWLLALTFCVSAVVLTALGVRARAGTLARSHLYGVRTRGTMVDEETYARSNQAVWWGYVVQGGIFAVEAVMTVFFALSGGPDVIFIVVIVMGMFIVLVVAATQVLVANRVARSTEAGEKSR
ncbi:SdpI family protein [Actinomyces lilanjuaniae]|uniref:SdpI family protein n=1 Tax=Actinomyces lilanjuaniae TaxID=2321394 RepID=A0ABN5PQI7_9ACTO|nr:SdpI family protein [Actinomyces lilanjuaniae]AYD89973.1 SdpI family protein [Actinomyces lilanjuaniae]